MANPENRQNIFNKVDLNHLRISQRYAILQQGIDLYKMHLKPGRIDNKAVVWAAEDLKNAVKLIPEGKQVVREVAKMEKNRRGADNGLVISK